MWQAHQWKMEVRFYMTAASALMVGMGSWLFHQTLLYEMQMMDELPVSYKYC
jgi:dihydroceramidase